MFVVGLLLVGSEARVIEQTLGMGNREITEHPSVEAYPRRGLRQMVSTERFACNSALSRMEFDSSC